MLLFFGGWGQGDLFVILFHSRAAVDDQDVFCGSSALGWISSPWFSKCWVFASRGQLFIAGSVLYLGSGAQGEQHSVVYVVLAFIIKRRI